VNVGEGLSSLAPTEVIVPSERALVDDKLFVVENANSLDEPPSSASSRAGTLAESQN
jgi:hypothetical protein